MTVSKRTRFEVLKRDNFTCRYCRSTEDQLTIDHVIPTALGGSDSPDNLVTCCADCNSGKTSTSPTEGMVDDVHETDMKWAGAMKRAAEVAAANRNLARIYVEAFDFSWGDSVPPDYETSLEMIRAAGLPEAEMIDAANIAMGAQHVFSGRFRYFCGVCWRKVADLQDIARAILDVDQVEDMVTGISDSMSMERFE